MTEFFALVLLAVGWVYLAGALWTAARFSRRNADATADSFGGISVLKPLYGHEPGLAENLRSFVAQDHPNFQVVLGLRDRTDPALPIARALIADHPAADIALVVDPQATGSNLKVANLENMLPAAKHDVLVLADSDMRVTPEYLRVVTAPLDDLGVGLVTCLYKGAAGSGLWSRLAALQINFAFLPGAIAGDALEMGGGCFGATIALRRDVLERIGGFARLRNELADDHRMGAAVRRLGLRTQLSRYIVEDRADEPSLARLWQHELRWARTSRMMAPIGYTGSIVTHAFALSIAAAALMGWTPLAWAGIFLTCLFRWIFAQLIARWLALPRPGLWLLPLRDALSFAVFVASFCGRSVLWRDQRFRIGASGRMSVQGD